MTAAEKHIRYYNSLNGQLINKKQLAAFHAALKKDISARRIDAHMPFGVECIDIEKNIAKVLPKMNGKALPVNVKVVDIDKILKAQTKQVLSGKKLSGDAAPIVKSEPGKKVVTQLRAVHQTRGSNTGASKEVSLKKPESPITPQHAHKRSDVSKQGGFFTLYLKPPYNDFVKIHSDSQIMIYGLPGSGKTWFQREFAWYLAQQYKLKILYASPEEYGRGTWEEKNKEQNFVLDVKPGYSTAVNGLLVFTKSINTLPPGKTLDDYDAFFFDSVDKMRWKLADFEDFCAKYPNKIKVITKQTTKEGDFKGGQEWAHEVDIEIEVRNKKRIFWKNRNDPKFAEKRDKLLFEDKIRVKQERATIQEKVKERIAPKGQQQIASFRPDTIV